MGGRATQTSKRRSRSRTARTRQKDTAKSSSKTSGSRHKSSSSSSGSAGMVASLTGGRGTQVRSLLPKIFSDQVDLRQITMNSLARVSVIDIIQQWLKQVHPILENTQRCVDVLDDHKFYQELRQPLRLTALMCTLGYAPPYYFRFFPALLHSSKPVLLNSLAQLGARESEVAGVHLRAMLNTRSGVEKALVLPSGSQLAGFFCHTPLRLYSRKTLKPVPSVPPQHLAADRLLSTFVVGWNTFYVLRDLELSVTYVVLRGTHNDFQGVPQYGRNLTATQVLHHPEYDPHTGRRHPGGSDTHPCVYGHYLEMVHDVLPHVRRCLRWLNPGSAVVWIGHSLGGALVTLVALHLARTDPKLFRRSRFRTLASPKCINAVAARELEDAVAKARVPNHFLQFVNTDDMVNVTYKLGGAKGTSASLSDGTRTFLNWLWQRLAETHNHRNLPQDIKVRALKLLSDEQTVAVQAFLVGALKAQIGLPVLDPRAAVHPGGTTECMQLWNQPETVSQRLGGYLRLVYCERHLRWEEEYAMRGHAVYDDTDTGLFWTQTRDLERALYSQLERQPLRDNRYNQLVVVPLMPEQDLRDIMPHVTRYVRHYRPKPSCQVRANQRLVKPKPPTMRLVKPNNNSG